MFALNELGEKLAGIEVGWAPLIYDEYLKNYKYL
jgi:hypothetical protein